MINLEYKIWETHGKGGSLSEQVKARRGTFDADFIIDPMRLKDMDKAVNIIHEAIESGDRIVVFGDYDVDGVTATAILMRYLEGVGAEVYYKLPNRIEEGYGISSDAVQTLHEKGVNLIITVDNGISATEAVETAIQLDMKIVVTDHHTPPEKLVPASAVVNPKRSDDDSGFETMSGAAVALCLVAAMEECTVNDIIYEYGELAALGTICDVMPLNEMNRTIVKEGLAAMNEAPCPGIEAILRVAGHIDNQITAQTLGFTIGPRLNAAGRIDDPGAALSLLLSSDEEEADELAVELDRCNMQRRKEETELIELLKKEAQAQSRQPVLVLFGKGYHEGVIGLAAARLLRLYSKPTIIISLDGDTGKGSGRSVDGFSLYDALDACKEHLLGFGGHTLAAGLSIEADRCEAFRKAINEYAKKVLKLVPKKVLKLDGTVTEKITVDTINSLSAFEPFGQENPTPCFLIENILIEQVSAMKDTHCRIAFSFAKERYWASCFGRTPSSLGYKVGDKVDLAVELSLYKTQNNLSVSITIRDIRPSKLSDEVVELSRLFADYYYGASLDDNERSSLYPDREFTAGVFRLLEGCSVLDNKTLLAKFKPSESGKVQAALYGLLELGLIYEKNDVLYKTVNPTKRMLTESEILRGLQ